MASLLGDSLALLNNATATSSWLKWRGGRGTLFAYGTFGGATVTLECRRGGATLSLGSAAALTAPCAVGFELPENTELRVSVAGGTPAGLFAEAVFNGAI